MRTRSRHSFGTLTAEITTRLIPTVSTGERAERFRRSAKRFGARLPGPLLRTPFLERLLRLLLRELLGFVGTLHGESLAAGEAGQRPREECAGLRSRSRRSYLPRSKVPPASAAIVSSASSSSSDSEPSV